MQPIEDVALFRWRLAETIAWCAPRCSLADRIYSLRTPALQPAVFTSVDVDFEELPVGRILEIPAKVQPIIEALAQERVHQLHRKDAYPPIWAEDLAGGRLLFYDPSENLADGAATAVSGGFFSFNNVPAWDTWLCFVQDQTESDQRLARVYSARADQQGESTVEPLHNEAFGVCLISWIPAQFVPLVTAGINVNPELCISWAEDLDIPLTRQLQMEGLLPGGDLDAAYRAMAEDEEGEAAALEWIEGTIGDSV